MIFVQSLPALVQVDLLEHKQDHYQAGLMAIHKRKSLDFHQESRISWQVENKPPKTIQNFSDTKSIQFFHAVWLNRLGSLPLRDSSAKLLATNPGSIYFFQPPGNGYSHLSQPPTNVRTMQLQHLLRTNEGQATIDETKIATNLPPPESLACGIMALPKVNMKYLFRKTEEASLSLNQMQHTLEYPTSGVVARVEVWYSAVEVDVMVNDVAAVAATADVWLSSPWCHTAAPISFTLTNGPAWRCAGRSRCSGPQLGSTGKLGLMHPNLHKRSLSMYTV